VPDALHNVDEADFLIVVFEKYPVLVVDDAVKGGFVAVPLFADPRLLGDDPTKMVQIANESIGTNDAEARLDIFRNPVGVIDEAVGINDATHREVLAAANSGAARQLGCERVFALDDSALPDVGKAASYSGVSLDTPNIVGHGGKFVREGDWGYIVLWLGNLAHKEIIP